MSNQDPKHLSPEEFRQKGYQMIDLVAEYMQNVESYPVLSQVEPGDIYNSFPPHPPQQGEPFENVLKDVNKKIIPGLTHWQSPKFFAFFPSHASGPSILGDLLSSGFGIQGMLWSTSPACTELETLVLDWMAEITGLPEQFHSSNSGGGVIQDSASTAALCAAVAAREKALAASGDRNITQLTAYISSHTHSSAEKSLRIAGFQSEQIRRLAVDDKFAICPKDFLNQINADLATNKIPAFVCATLGTTSSLAFDPVCEIAQIANDNHIWVHVDAAYAGSAAVCPEFRHLLDGVECVHSYCFNPHKWLLTNFDCDLFYVANKSDLVDALTMTPEYLRNKATESGAVFDYSGWQISLGRRFRSLKLWFVIRHYGVEGLRAHIRKHIELAKHFEEQVSADENYELFQPRALNLICFRHKDGDKKTKRILEGLNASGELFLTHTVLNDVYVMRFVPGAIRTEIHHIEAAWKAISRAGAT